MALTKNDEFDKLNRDTYKYYRLTHMLNHILTEMSSSGYDMEDSNETLPGKLRIYPWPSIALLRSTISEFADVPDSLKERFESCEKIGKVVDDLISTLDHIETQLSKASTNTNKNEKLRDDIIQGYMDSVKKTMSVSSEMNNALYAALMKLRNTDFEKAMNAQGGITLQVIAEDMNAEFFCVGETYNKLSMLVKSTTSVNNLEKTREKTAKLGILIDDLGSSVKDLIQKTYFCMADEFLMNCRGIRGKKKDEEAWPEVSTLTSELAKTCKTNLELIERLSVANDSIADLRVELEAKEDQLEDLIDDNQSLKASNQKLLDDSQILRTLIADRDITIADKGKNIVALKAVIANHERTIADYQGKTKGQDLGINPPPSLHRELADFASNLQNENDNLLAQLKERDIQNLALKAEVERLQEIEEETFHHTVREGQFIQMAQPSARFVSATDMLVETTRFIADIDCGISDKSKLTLISSLIHASEEALDIPSLLLKGESHDKQ